MIPGRIRPNISALRRAVQASAAWHGNVTGDDAAEEAFLLEIAKQRKALYNLRRHMAYHNALRSFVSDLARLDSEDPRDEKRMAALIRSVISRAQRLYP